MAFRVASLLLLLAASIAGCAPPVVPPDPARSHAPESAASESVPDPTPLVSPSPATRPDPPAPEVQPPTTPAPRNRGDVVPDAIDWLARRQSPDGSWDGDVGTTGLVLLVFTGSGETHQSGSYRLQVKRGLAYLRDHQDAAGAFGPRTGDTSATDHGLAALAMVEAYGMTQSEPLADAAQRGLAFALAMRTPGGGWHRAPPRAADLNVETTGWMVMLLKSAVVAEVGDAAVNKAAIDEAVADLGRCVDPATGRAGGDPGSPDTAIVLLSRILAGHTPKTDDLLRRIADAVIAEPPSLATGRDVERTYFGTMAIYSFGGRRWRAWNVPMNDLLIASQCAAPDAVEYGSWDARGTGTAAGRVRATAFGCLMLSVYYRLGDMEGWRRDGDKWNE